MNADIVCFFDEKTNSASMSPRILKLGERLLSILCWISTQFQHARRARALREYLTMSRQKILVSIGFSKRMSTLII